MYFPASRSIKRAATPSRNARGVLSRASRAAISTWWDCRWRGCTGCWGNWVGQQRARKNEYPPKNKNLQSVGNEKKTARRGGPSANFNKIGAPEFLDYFFSGDTGATGGGVCCGGAVGGAGFPDIPSLKLRIPSPSPFITSGMRRPPKKIITMARTINQWATLN